MKQALGFLERSNMLSSFILGAVILVAVFLVLSRIDAFLRLKAFNDCALNSRYEKEFPKEGVRVSYPATELYRKCLKERGY
ncbi:hypothetical protein HYT33_03725 [Candidatus Roizmanbacteria bacterium]|nr:hypothetical protein [Candidatus Roizmanbacteria bacterium]